MKKLLEISGLPAIQDAKTLRDVVRQVCVQTADQPIDKIYVFSSEENGKNFARCFVDAKLNKSLEAVGFKQAEHSIYIVVETPTGFTYNLPLGD